MYSYKVKEINKHGVSCYISLVFKGKDIIHSTIHMSERGAINACYRAYYKALNN